MARPGILGALIPGRVQSHGSTAELSEGLCEHVVKMVFEVRERGQGHGEIARMARQMGIHPEALLDPAGGN